jgi:hypothetical protein
MVSNFTRYPFLLDRTLHGKTLQSAVVPHLKKELLLTISIYRTVLFCNFDYLAKSLTSILFFDWK